MREQLPQQRSSETAEAAMLAARIAYWNCRLDELSAEVDGDFIEEAMADLDSYWEYTGGRCWFGGYGQHTYLDTRGEPVVSEDFIDMREGRSNGFGIAKFGREGAQRWRVAYWFQLTEDVVESDVMIRADWASIVPVREVDEPLAALSAELEPGLHDMLSVRSDRLAEQLLEPAFLRLRAPDQLSVIGAAIREAEDRSRQFGDIKGRQVMAEAEHAFRAVAGGKGYIEFEEQDTSAMIIQGECLGLDVLCRSRLRRQPINYIDELIDERAGLCLVVRASLPTVRALYGDSLTGDLLLYLPISGQQLGVNFVSLGMLEDLYANR